MKLAKYFVLLILFRAVDGGRAAQAQTKTVGLADLILLAEENNFSISESRIKLSKAESGVTSARAELLPSIGIESRADYAISPVSGWQSNAGLVIRQKLFDGGQSWTDLGRGQTKRDQAAQNTLDARETMAFDVITAFTKCSTLETSLIASKRKLELLSQQFDLVNRQFRQGLKNQRDYQLLEADVELAKLAVESIRSQIYQAYRNLEIVVGSPGLNLDGGHVTLMTGERILAMAKWQLTGQGFKPETENPELKSLALGVQDRDLALRQSRLQYFPSLSLEASAAYGTNGFIGNQPSPWRDNLGWNTTIGVTLNWTLWDWGGVPSVVAQARADRLLESKRFDQAKLKVHNQFASLQQTIERRARIVEVQKRIRELAKLSFENIQKEYREGRAGYLDLISALDRSITAETSFETEALSYFMSIAELYKLKGTLYENAKTL